MISNNIFSLYYLGKRLSSDAAYSPFGTKLQKLINKVCIISMDCGKNMGKLPYFVGDKNVVQNAQRTAQNFSGFVK